MRSKLPRSIPVPEFLHRDPHAMHVELRFNRQSSFATGDRAHSVDRIHDQVEKSLLQLRPFGHYLWKAIDQFVPDRYPTTFQFLLYQP